MDGDHRLLVGDSAVELMAVPDRSCRLLITSPPYNIGKEYERGCKLNLDDYMTWLGHIIDLSSNKITDDGHFCWQIGNSLHNGEIFPLDFFLYNHISKLGFKLRNRIIWHFNFGRNATRRFSGRYETLLWFTRSDDYFFHLDNVRVPQLYPGKRHSRKRGEKSGLPSGNPLGKNPSDFWVFDPVETFKHNPIWEMPNVKANHPEKSAHPCQFPSELVERCILAMTEPSDCVLDPFVGAGTTVIAAAMHGRRAIGIDKSTEYIDLAKVRLQDYLAGRLVTRPVNKPVRQPRVGERVATFPDEWKAAAE